MKASIYTRAYNRKESDASKTEVDTNVDEELKNESGTARDLHLLESFLVYMHGSTIYLCKFVGISLVSTTCHLDLFSVVYCNFVCFAL